MQLINKIEDHFINFISQNLGVGESNAGYLYSVIALIIIIGLGWLANLIVKRFLLGLVRSLIKKTKISQQDKDALQVMELNEEVKWEQIHSKFKELVKKYHPDKNQGNKKFEEKLKKITLAYSQLKKTLGKK